MTPTPAPTADKPALILIIPQSALETIPVALATGIRGCEAAYRGGMWYVTVPCEIYSQWPNEARIGVGA